jgi:RNA recognition motif-containing protein
MEVLVPMVLYDANGNPQYVYVPSKLGANANPATHSAPFTPGPPPPANSDGPRLASFGLQPFSMAPPRPSPGPANVPSAPLAMWNPFPAPQHPPVSAPAPLPQPVIVSAPPPMINVTTGPAVAPAVASRTLHVANMPPCITPEKLRRMFAGYGSIVDCRLIKKPGNPSARAIGFVEFTTHEMAMRAQLALDGMVVDGWRLTVRHSDNDREVGSGAAAAGPSSNVYVANLPPDCNDARLRSIFAPHGHVLSLVVFKDLRTGLCKGSGMVRFSSIAEATDAIRALNRQLLPGLDRPLEVKYAEGKSERASRRHPKGDVVAPRFPSPPKAMAPPSPPLKSGPPSPIGSGRSTPPSGAAVQPPSASDHFSAHRSAPMNLNDFCAADDFFRHLKLGLEGLATGAASKSDIWRPQPNAGFGWPSGDRDDDTPPQSSEDSLGPASSEPEESPTSAWGRMTGNLTQGAW